MANLCRPLKRLPALLALAAALAAAEPPVIDAAVATRHAPVIATTDHGAIGQNALVTWWAIAPGSDGSALYGACQPVRTDDDGNPNGTPLLFRLELATGRLVEHVAKGEILQRDAPATADIDLADALAGDPAAAPEPLTTGWTIGTPLWAAGAGDRVYIGSSTGAVFRYYPQDNAFQRAFSLPTDRVAIAATALDDQLFLVDAKGRVQRRDSFGLEPLAPAQLAAAGVRLVTAPGRRPALALTAPPPLSFTVTVDFAVDPPVTVQAPGQEPRRWPVVFGQAAWDKGKSLTLGPDGQTLYGAGWPTAWIYSYSPATGQLRRHGRDYVWYDVMPWRDELVAIGYYGIKLMRWRPTQPWTFSEEAHYIGKQPWPAHESPFGARDSNPRLVARFRYHHRLNIRRPSGFAYGADGRFYTGAKNAAHMFYLDSPPDRFDGTRYAGALCWYDPASETIGIEREPFLHLEVTDLAAIAQGRTIAIAAKSSLNPFDPPPDPPLRAQALLWDTQSHQFVHQADLTGARLWYVEEAAPGHAVFAGEPGRYAGEGIRSVLVVLDVASRQVLRVIRLPVHIAWDVYDASDKFERGPDQQLYFYGTDADGTALFRLDSTTGTVQPLWREPQVSDFATYVVKGPPFCFARDRLYLATTHLRSLPLAALGLHP